MKKIHLLLAMSLLCLGCTSATGDIQTQEPQQLSAVIQENTDNTLFMDVSMDYSVSEEIPGIAIIRIVNIEGADNKNAYGEDTPSATTYGTFETIKVYKGDLTEGQQYSFARLGGTIPYEDYLNGCNEESRNKQLALHKEEPLPEWIHISYEGGIDIEEGNVYFAIYAPYDDSDRIFLGSFAEDFRLVDENTLDSEDIQVYNNTLERWQNIYDTGYVKG